jgi:hypothetical protein
MMNFSPITSSLAAGMSNTHWLLFAGLVVIFVAVLAKAFDS